jgi:hypothetical protein
LGRESAPKKKKRKWEKKRKNLQDSLAKGVRADAEGLKGVCTKRQPVYRLQVHLKKKNILGLS